MSNTNGTIKKKKRKLRRSYHHLSVNITQILIYLYIYIIEAAEAFAQKEKEWKTQLSTLRNKLTQAGSHLKTLTQENARLNKQINEFTNKESTWNKERDENSRIAIELVTALEKVLGHQSPVPDVSSTTKLEQYARDAEKHFSTKLEHIKNEVTEKSKEEGSLFFWLPIRVEEFSG